MNQHIIRVENYKKKVLKTFKLNFIYRTDYIKIQIILYNSFKTF
jgi:hypothetical protein